MSTLVILVGLAASGLIAAIALTVTVTESRRAAARTAEAALLARRWAGIRNPVRDPADFESANESRAAEMAWSAGSGAPRIG